MNKRKHTCVRAVHARARASVTFIIAVIEWQANRCGVARTIPGRVVRPIFFILSYDILYDFISFVIFSTTVTVNLRMRHRSAVVISARYWRIFEKVTAQSITTLTLDSAANLRKWRKIACNVIHNDGWKFAEFVRWNFRKCAGIDSNSILNNRAGSTLWRFVWCCYPVRAKSRVRPVYIMAYLHSEQSIIFALLCLK